MVEENLVDHPHRRHLVAAYGWFRAGKPRIALDVLEPVVEHDDLANCPSVMAGILWGLAGDCYFQLEEAEKGFRAYRRAIEMDGNTGCLTLFACQVAWHRRVEDAGEAIRCLRAARAADWQALRCHPVHFLRHSLGLWALYFRFVRVPLARWRLRRLVAQASDGGSPC